jgi:hypothetical protein
VTSERETRRFAKAAGNRSDLMEKDQTPPRVLVVEFLLESPDPREIPNIPGDQITLPTSQKLVYGHFRTSLSDRTINFSQRSERDGSFSRINIGNSNAKPWRGITGKRSGFSAPSLLF